MGKNWFSFCHQTKTKTWLVWEINFQVNCAFHSQQLEDQVCNVCKHSSVSLNQARPNWSGRFDRMVTVRYVWKVLHASCWGIHHVIMVDSHTRCTYMIVWWYLPHVITCMLFDLALKLSEWLLYLEMEAKIIIVQVWKPSQVLPFSAGKGAFQKLSHTGQVDSRTFGKPRGQLLCISILICMVFLPHFKKI